MVVNMDFYIYRTRHEIPIKVKGINTKQLRELRKRIITDLFRHPEIRKDILELYRKVWRTTILGGKVGAEDRIKNPGMYYTGKTEGDTYLYIRERGELEISSKQDWVVSAGSAVWGDGSRHFRIYPRRARFLKILMPSGETIYRKFVETYYSAGRFALINKIFIGEMKGIIKEAINLLIDDIF